MRTLLRCVACYLLTAAITLAAQTTPTAPNPPAAVSLPLSGGGFPSTWRLNLDTTGYVTVTVCAMGCDYTAAQFQDALNDAAAEVAGTRVHINNATTITGNYSVPVDAVGRCAAGKYIYIRSTDLSTIPADGNTITAADTGELAMIRTSTNGSAALTVSNGGCNVIVEGIEFSSTVDTTVGLLHAGDAQAATVAAIPTKIIMSRVLVRGRDTGEVRRGVLMACNNCTLINSHVDRIHQTTGDTQAVAIADGSTGPYLIDHNYLEAAGENFFACGFGSALPTPNQPGDITFTRNHVFKPAAAWLGVWQMKNLFELKCGQRVLVEGNKFQGFRVDAQSASVIIKAENSSDETWITYSDVTFRYNHFDDIEGVWLSAVGDNGTTSQGFGGRLSVHGNLLTNGDVTTSQRTILIANDDPMPNISVRHNTLLNEGGASRTIDVGVDVGTGEIPTENFAFHDNIAAFHSNNGVGDNCTVNSVDTDCVTTTSAHNGMFFDNGSGTMWCGGTEFYAVNAVYCNSGDITAVGFVNAGAGNYRLDVGSVGKSAALDGLDVGITATGYELMACLTNIAVTGVSANCSPASQVPRGLQVPR